MQRIVDVGNLLRNQFQLVCRQILRKDSSLAVEHESPDRRHGFDANTVTLRAFGEVGVVDDLQVHETGNHEAEQQDRDDARQYDPRDEQAALQVMVLDGR